MKESNKQTHIYNYLRQLLFITNTTAAMKANTARLIATILSANSVLVVLL